MASIWRDNDPKRSHRKQLESQAKLLKSQQPKKQLVAYWEGYTEGGVKPYPIEEVPEDVKYIPIAFIAPLMLPGDQPNKATGWTFDANFVYSKQEIIAGIKKINERDTDQLVLLSLLDCPEVQWHQVDIPKFAENIVADAREMGIKGFDLDLESGMPSKVFKDKFVSLAKNLKKFGPEMIVTMVSMGLPYDKQIVSAVKDDIFHLTTMRYWDTQEDLFTRFSEILGPEKVGIGVMTITTSPEMVNTIAEFECDRGSNIMMLWSLTRDVKPCSYTDDGYWRTMLNTKFVGCEAGDTSLVQRKPPVSLSYLNATLSLRDRESGSGCSQDPWSIKQSENLVVVDGVGR